MAHLLLATNLYPHLMAAALRRAGHQVWDVTSGRDRPPEASIDVIICGQKLLPPAIVQAQPLACYQTHVRPLFKWLPLAQKKSAAILYLSSAIVYGQQLNATENAPLHPADTQAQSLVAAEAMATACGPTLLIRRTEVVLDEAACTQAATTHEQQDLKNASSILQEIAAVAIGQQQSFTLAGADFATPDGTALCDLLPLSIFLQGILGSVAYLTSSSREVPAIFNLGSGQGITIRQMMAQAEALAQRPLPYQLKPRRPGQYHPLTVNPRKAALAWRLPAGPLPLKSLMRTAFQQAARNFSAPAIARP